MLQQQIHELDNLFMSGILTQDEYDEIINDFSYRSENLKRIKKDSINIESTKMNIRLIDFDVDKKPKTLATIFAVEQKKLENVNNA
ncbi:hypothetical protein CF139_05640 [Aeromonas hydrophila]|nr:hypothetical protein CF139_05640 [Aeromonas hydrophila]